MKFQMLAVVLSQLLLLPALAQTHPVSTPLPQAKPMTEEQTVDLLKQQGLSEIQPQGGNLAVARDRTGQQVRVTIDPRSRSILRTQAIGGP